MQTHLYRQEIKKNYIRINFFLTKMYENQI